MSGFGDRLTDSGQSIDRQLGVGGPVEILRSSIDDTRTGLAQLSLRRAFLAAKYDFVPGGTRDESLNIAVQLGLVEVVEDTKDNIVIRSNAGSGDIPKG